MTLLPCLFRYVWDIFVDYFLFVLMYFLISTLLCMIFIFHFFCFPCERPFVRAYNSSVAHLPSTSANFVPGVSTGVQLISTSVWLEDLRCRAPPSRTPAGP